MSVHRSAGGPIQSASLQIRIYTQHTSESFEKSAMF